MLFLQETYSTLKDEVRWRDEFNAEFFSHSTSNSWGVAITFLGTNDITIKKKISDTEGKFLILDIEIASEKFVFINLHNPNTESKHVKTF